MDPSTSSQERQPSFTPIPGASLPSDPIAASPLNASLTGRQAAPQIDQTEPKVPERKAEVQSTLGTIAQEVFPQWSNPALRRYNFLDVKTHLLVAVTTCSSMLCVGTGISTLAGAIMAAQGVVTGDISMALSGTALTVGGGAAAYGSYQLTRFLGKKASGAASAAGAGIRSAGA